MTTVLIVEDEVPIRELIRDNLQYEGFATLEAGTLGQAFKEIKKKPDVTSGSPSPRPLRKETPFL